MKARFILDAALFVIYLIAMNTDGTGIPVHEWLSVGVAIVVIMHLLTEWEWTISVLSRFFRRLFSLSRLHFVVDTLLFVVFTLVMLSGFLVSQSILPLFGFSVPFGPTWRIIHAVSGDFSLVVLGVHVGLHWRWIVSAVKRVTAQTPAPDSAM
jgi:hypothetical protein